jgi:putative DNA primase/helicase
VFGEYAYAASFSTFELHQRAQIPSDVAALAGRRFVIASETNPRTRLNEARLKAIVGGDKMNARHLYGREFEFRPVCKVWLSVNHRPTVTDDSFGFWRKVQLVPFARTFSGSTDDKTLKDQLRAEASGILRWAVEGCLEWQHDGLTAPPSVVAAVDDYQRASDPIADFLDECCIADEAARVRAADLYGAYGTWCQRSGISDRGRLSMKRFGEAMRRHAAVDREPGTGKTRYVAWRLQSLL